MKTLYLLRHADAPMSLDMSDKDRPLSSHGINQAKNMAQHIAPIDHVLCSSAVRTRMTYDAIIEGGAQVERVEYWDDLYNAPAGSLMAALQKCDADHVMIIAHNPGIHVMAAMLAGQGKPQDLENVGLFYDPATLSVFECDIESWAEIQPAANTLTGLFIPE